MLASVYVLKFCNLKTNWGMSIALLQHELKEWLAVLSYLKGRLVFALYRFNYGVLFTFVFSNYSI
jgi:hypothetical protein